MPSFGFYTIVVVALLALPVPRVETLVSVAALPPHLAASFEEPDGFLELPSGEYLVADRRGHTVYLVDREMTVARPIIRIGQEQGHILQPFGFDVDVEAGLVAVGDSPGPFDRVQVFTTAGSRVAGFTLPLGTGPRLRAEGFVLNGIRTLHVTPGHTVLVNRPESGVLISEYDFYGRVVAGVGHLRATGHENDPALHLALNRGLPLAIPSGGYYFVFQGGEPRFLRFDQAGTLQYERAIQGPELDRWLQEQPATWRRSSADQAGLVPLVAPAVRTAAVAADGRLWVGLAVPYTYVYDADGERARTVQFKGAGVLQPTSIAFAPDGRLLVTPGGYVFQP
jgi:hypothetical protein